MSPPQRRHRADRDRRVAAALDSAQITLRVRLGTPWWEKGERGERGEKGEREGGEIKLTGEWAAVVRDSINSRRSADRTTERA